MLLKLLATVSSTSNFPVILKFVLPLIKEISKAKDFGKEIIFLKQEKNFKRHIYLASNGTDFMIKQIKKALEIVIFLL